MTTTSPHLDPPPWPHCAAGASPDDPVGCRGVIVDPYDACLAHLPEAFRTTYLAGLAPGTEVHHSGTPFTGDLLHRLLHALRDPDSGRLLVRHARFEAATFSGTADFGGVAFEDVWFDGAVFSGDAVFRRASFDGNAGFSRTVFAGSAGFSKAVFSRAADFGGAVFALDARFDNATFAGATFVGTAFSGDAWFGAATFSEDVRFDRATFTEANFRGAVFSANAGFTRASFSGSALFDRAVFSGAADLREAVFSGDAGFLGVRFDGDARFGGATFSHGADFHDVTFSRDAWFVGVAFSGSARFSSATLAGSARFDAAQFSAEAVFRRTAFSGDAHFAGAVFSGGADFGGAVFSGEAAFRGASFSGDARFGAAAFSAGAFFSGATFETLSRLGPLVCRGELDLSGARFGGPVTIEAASALFTCVRTRWESTATLRLRYATVDLTDAVIEYPLSVTTRPSAFTHDRRPVDESALAGRDPSARITSLSGVDAAHLALTDVDLSGCRLTGTFHLDQLRLEGRCVFADAPAGLHRHGALPARWTQRRTLAEEHHWRAANGSTGWTPAPSGTTPQQPAALAPVYRQLRKSFEDAKNEPDAADFYYGEMEMRRHDGDRPRSERALLTLYWAVSGYGLRASRALAWLLGAMAATVLVMVLWGIPGNDLQAVTTGHLTGQDISLTTDDPTPVNPSGPLRSRLTSQRWEKSLHIVVNSVVFRSSDQNLTTTGTYTEMASRLTEPALLGLAVLALRGRVKR
ncbi:pentapeptide repeat-containing protein [Streptomyces sp. Go40/10]|uniref:pentapeptide repeat-containing protein n=1 Tax=Streptomyces sp. Go40/10 TaxID=2825844 RepID=UPI001E50A863|nr:pentapeptide repeat-containing protein [Streptomyces sp. Go40/10]UFR00212.1 pentapeptide repeat-containing protein [Streptomyces sp. Go40/10]